MFVIAYKLHPEGEWRLHMFHGNMPFFSESSAKDAKFQFDGRYSPAISEIIPITLPVPKTDHVATLAKGAVVGRTAMILDDLPFLAVDEEGFHAAAFRHERHRDQWMSEVPIAGLSAALAKGQPISKDG